MAGERRRDAAFTLPLGYHSVCLGWSPSRNVGQRAHGKHCQAASLTTCSRSFLMVPPQRGSELLPMVIREPQYWDGPLRSHITKLLRSENMPKTKIRRLLIVMMLTALTQCRLRAMRLRNRVSVLALLGFFSYPLPTALATATLIPSLLLCVLCHPGSQAVHSTPPHA